MDSIDREKMIADFRTELAKAADTLQGYIPGAKVTLIVRYPAHPEAFAVAGQDDLDAIEDVIRRAKAQVRQ